MNKNIKKIEEDIKKLELEVEELKKKKEGKWKPRYGEKYFFINIRGAVDCYNNDNNTIDDYVINNTKIFKTSVEAEEYRKYIKAKKEYSTEFTKEEWKNEDIEKYYIYFNYFTKKLCQSCNCCVKYMNTTFFTEENAEEFMKKYEKQILKYEFGIEEDI